jgi:hypothetical protein
MSKNLGPPKSPLLRRAALAGVVALSAAAAFVGATPAAAMHGGMFMHHGFGGMHHDFDRRMGMGRDFDFDRHRHFRHDFDDRFAFGGFGYFPTYASDDYSAYDTCYRRVWGPYGWRLIYVCQ